MARKIAGLDIGSRVIRIVELENIKGTWALKGCESIERPECQDHPEWLSSVLTELKSAGKLSADVLVTGIPTSNFTLRPLTLPFKNPKRIEQVIGIEMESHLTFPIEEAIIDYTMVGEGQPSTAGKQEKKGWNIFAFAVREKILEEHLNMFSSCGVAAQRVVPDVVPLWSAALASMKEDSVTDGDGNKEGVTVIIDMGFDHTLVAVIRAGVFSFARVIGLGIGALVEKGAESAAVIKESGVSHFIKELKLTLTSAGNYTGSEKIYRTILGGVGAACPELVESLSPKLDGKVSVYEPGAALSGGQKIGPEYLQAAGLAFTEIEKEAIGINLMRKYSKTTQVSFNLLRRHVAIASLLVILTSVVFIFGLYANLYLKQARLKFLETKIKDILVESVPGTAVVKGNELRQLRDKAGESGKRLAFFEGLKTDFSPLDVLYAMSMHTSYGLNLNLNSMVIKSDAKPESVTLEGEIATFDFDKFKRDLSNVPIFRDMKLEKTATSAGTEGMIGFKLSLTVVKEAPPAIKEPPPPPAGKIVPSRGKASPVGKKPGGKKKK